MRIFDGGNMPGYIERDGSDITSVYVAPNVRVPVTELEEGISIDDVVFRRHLLGGGLVADSSYVPDTISVPHQITIGVDTRVVSQYGMAGQLYIQGNLRNPGDVSVAMDNEGRLLRSRQKMVGIVERLLAIERAQSL